jgi:hypothetical protein
MKQLLVILTFISTNCTALAANEAPLKIREGLRQFGITALSGVLVSGKSCIASYEVNESGSLLTISLKTTKKDGQTKLLQASLGPLVNLKEFDGGTYLSDVAADENVRETLSTMIFNPDSEEIDAVTVYQKTDVAQCIKYPDINANHALLVNLTSQGGRLNSKVEKDFYKFVGAKISDYTLEQMVVKGYGDEGGKIYCLEINRNYTGKKLARLLIEIQDDLKLNIKPDAGMEFSLTLNQTCKP